MNLRRILKYRICSFCLIFHLCCLVSLTVVAGEQNEKLSVKFENASLLVILEDLSTRSGCVILYNHEQVRGIKGITLDMKDKSISEILTTCLQNSRFTFKLVDGVYVITRDSTVPEQEKIRLSGVVMDEEGNPLPGVTIIIKGTQAGITTDKDGLFNMSVPEASDLTLVFSFLGMETKEILVKNRKELRIILKKKMEVLDDVVVTGYANVKKTSFTGNSVQVKKEDLLKVSSRNIIDALQVFDPSFRIMKNNEMGSDPNTLPEFYIRGRSGIGVKELDKGDISRSALQNNPNTPIFIMDGFEVTVEKVYDFDPNRIESITILKDAAATAIYGSRAANGVVVIETKLPQPGKFAVSYNLTAALTAPDLSDYNLMNASEKLEAERLADLYKSDNLGEQLILDREYQGKLNNILRGIDTDWLALPLRNIFNHKHSIYLEGGAKGIRIGVDLKYDDQNGVMKKSSRKRYGVGLNVEYRFKNVQIREHVTYDIVKAINSPYGEFRTYTMLMPYDTYKDDHGIYKEYIDPWHSGATRDNRNPLYEAEILNNFDQEGYTDLTNNLGINWYITDFLTFKGDFAVTKNDGYADRFLDPASGKFVLYTAEQPKGELKQDRSSRLTWNANAVANMVKSFYKHHMNLSLGVNARQTAYSMVSTFYRGFPSGNLNAPNYAEEIVGKPSTEDNKVRLFGSFCSLNYTWNDIYLLDASVRLDGSSEFGSNKKYAPFWSAGAGINIHKYAFLNNNEWLTQLKIRGSYGQVGKVNFEPYAAQHTYSVLSNWYGTGNGVVLYYMGNNDLKWEKTNILDVGFDLGLWKDRIYLKGSWYNKQTIDLITDVTIRASSGFISYKDNIGEVRNRGVEFEFRADILKTKDLNFALFGNLAHNTNKIMKISSSLKAYNDKVDAQYDGYDKDSENLDYAKAFTKYVEGGSLTSIFGMQSLGINPNNGQEVYLKTNGEMTYLWNAKDQVILGDKEPDVQGSFGLNLRYKNFSVYATFMYEYGGQIYNQTLVNKVENVNLYETNADKRALYDRWSESGQHTRLKSIKERNLVTRPTSRFVQNNNTLDFNSLTVGYDFGPRVLQRIGFSMLNLQFNMKDVAHFSTVKQERGLAYPFARTFNFSLNASF